MLLITQILYYTNIYIFSYTHHNLKIINQDMMYWYLNHVLNTSMFSNNFLDKDAPAVFCEIHWGGIFLEVLSMNTEYWRKNNLKLINTKERAGKNRDVTEECFISIFLVCNFYAYYRFHMNIVTVLASSWCMLLW